MNPRRSRQVRLGCRLSHPRLRSGVFDGSQLTRIRGTLILAHERDALDRTFLGSYALPRDRSNSITRSVRIFDPTAVEVVWAFRQAVTVLLRVDHAGVPPVKQLEEVVLRLPMRAKIADQELGEGRVLDAHLLLAALAER